MHSLESIFTDSVEDVLQYNYYPQSIMSLELSKNRSFWKLGTNEIVMEENIF